MEAVCSEQITTVSTNKDKKMAPLFVLATMPGRREEQGKMEREEGGRRGGKEPGGERGEGEGRGVMGRGRGWDKHDNPCTKEEPRVFSIANISGTRIPIQHTRITRNSYREAFIMKLLSLFP